MIALEEFEEAYNLLLRICKTKDKIDNYYHKQNGSFIYVPSIVYYDNEVKSISVPTNVISSRDKISFNTVQEFSFIRNDVHRKHDVNIQFVYHLGSNLRYGQTVIPNFDYSEANLFQQSLVMDSEDYVDLEFLFYLKSKKFPTTIVLVRNAFSISGLKEIDTTMNDFIKKVGWDDND